MLVPAAAGEGINAVCLGLIKALKDKGAKVGFFNPVESASGTNASAVVKETFGIASPEPVNRVHASRLIAEGDETVLLEEILGEFEEYKAAGSYDVIVAKGTSGCCGSPWADELNYGIANAIDAEVVLVSGTKGGKDNFHDRVDTLKKKFQSRLQGLIVNKAGQSGCCCQGACSAKAPFGTAEADIADAGAKLLGFIPFEHSLFAPRAKDIAAYLGAETLNEGEAAVRRPCHPAVASGSVESFEKDLTDGAMVFCDSTRTDLKGAVFQAARDGKKLAGVVFTNAKDPKAVEFCDCVKENGLPVFATSLPLFAAAGKMSSFKAPIAADDKEKAELAAAKIAAALDADWVASLTKDDPNHVRRMSPAAFRYMLTQKAKAANKRIVLPEGTEPRTIRAAAICAQRGIAKPVLLGNVEEIKKVAAEQGVSFDGLSIELVDPENSRENYVERLVELRKKKGLTPEQAREQLKDNVMLGTMMIERGEVDGLVSGAVHTTANTIRPAFQIIKTAPGSKIVSSVFFMLMPEQVLVYGDCAVNPAPTAEELAEIAIQSADTAKAFGIDPKVAMISYSTLGSGKGEAVDLVVNATKLAQEKRPDLAIDGPLQYDAAYMPDVAKNKAPNSPVAGKANVFIFPELTTGNCTYKAVQRSAGLVSIGPMLQGLRRPVNDLSRGALVDDIVYTIALTAIQAAQIKD